MIKEIYVHEKATDYIENTLDDRTFTDILMTIWAEAEKTPGFNMRSLREDIEELMRRYAMNLENVDYAYLGAEVDE